MIVDVSRDEVFSLEVIIFIFSWRAIDRWFEFSMRQGELHGVDAWCSTSYAQRRPYNWLILASHVLTPQGLVAMLRLQRHLLAGDAQDDMEIIYQERHARDSLVGKLYSRELKAFIYSM